ncbi:replication protein A 32 kDa subunit-like [Limulus polyphemus]|uniref:Replication protein A 32 kDa subunit-like n=1 Tax=Limulus polyphemus TaxID=6850 RepID=A0ABM1BBL0_LIMPO|nr:replication protein A 32 kDa subunit-like [Limulus polyphemus]XP_013778723.1 replication protein A 32 kDa subunit-like [Limulus polyphemus]
MWNTNMDQHGFDQTGGGFLNSSGNFGSPAVGSPNEKRKGERLHNVVPVTVAQVLQASDKEEHLKVGSMECHILTLVGLVRSVDEQTTRITYQLDDFTGPPLEVQMWFGENEEFSDKRSSIMENTYLRVYGGLRTFKGKRLLNAFKVTPVTNLNEVTMHILEVVHTSMAIAVMDSQNAQAMSTTGFIAEPPGNTQMGMNISGGAMLADVGSMFGLDRNQQLVFRAISAATSEEGISFQHLCESLKSLTPSVIRKVVEFLSNEGHIYTTTDDDHYKATDSG